jgi:hypothetical protein
MSHADEIMALLKDLKSRSPPIKACMIARKGLEGLIIFPSTFKDEVAYVWEPLSRSMDDMLGMVGRYSYTGLTRGYLELLGFGVLFMAFPMSDTALIVFVKSEKPLEEAVEVLKEAEATRDKILKVE